MAQNDDGEGPSDRGGEGDWWAQLDGEVRQHVRELAAVLAVVLLVLGVVGATYFALTLGER